MKLGIQNRIPFIKTKNYILPCHLKPRLFLFVIIILNIFKPIEALSQMSYSVQKFDETNGLQTILVSDLIMDQNEILWILNKNKILSFGGHKFNYWPLVIGSDTIEDDYFYFFFPIGPKDIYIETHNSYYKLNIETENVKFEKLPLKKENYLLCFTKQDVNRLTKSFNYSWFYFKGYFKHAGYEYYFNENAIYSNPVGNKHKRYSSIIPSRVRGYIKKDNKVYFILENKVLQAVNGKITKEIPVLLNGKTFQLVNDFSFKHLHNYDFLINPNGIFEITIKNETLELQKLIPKEYIPSDFGFYLACNKDKSIIALASKEKGVSIFKYNYIKVIECLSSNNGILYYNNCLFPNNNRGFSWDWEGNLKGQNKNLLSFYSTSFIYTKDSELVYMKNDTTLIVQRKKSTPKELTINLPLASNNITTRFFNYHDTTFIINGKIAGYINKNTYVNLPHPKTLIKDFVYDFRILNDTVWLANDSGLCYYKLRDKNPEFTWVVTKKIRRIIPDRNGRGLFLLGYGTPSYLWINNTLLPLPRGPENKLDYCQDLCIDRFNRLWLPNDRGLLCTDYEIWYHSITNKNIMPFYYTFGKEDGLLTSEFNGGNPNSSLYLPQKDLLFFSSVKGIVRVDAKENLIRFPNNNIEIASSEINNQFWNGFPASVLINGTVKINLNCPYWGNLQNLQMEYKWEFEESGWKPIYNSTVNLDRPGPGLKGLLIRYRNGFGNNDYHVQRFELNYKYFWFEHWYFQLLGFVFIILVIIISVGIRTRYLLKKQKELEEIVRQKTIIIQNKVDELTLSESNLLESDHMREKLIRVLAHDIRSPLKSITHVTNFTIQKLAKLKEKEVQDSLPVLNEIANSIDNLYHYSSDFLKWYHFKQIDAKPNKTFFRLNDLVEKSLTIYSPIIRADGNQLKTILDENITLFQDFEVLNIVLRNLIDNANKYTRNSEIILETGFKNNTNYILVRNKPINLSPELKDSIKNKFKGNVPEENALDFKVGLNLIAFLLKKLEVEIEINFPEDTWMEYILLFPETDQ